MLVFGESVLNDAVSIVIYRLFESIAQADEIDGSGAAVVELVSKYLAWHVFLSGFAWNMPVLSVCLQVLLGILKFIWVSVGGTLTGTIIGAAAVGITRCSPSWTVYN